MFMFGKKFREVAEVGIKIFAAVKIDNGLTGLGRNGSCRLSAVVSMDKEFLAILFVTGEHAVDVSSGTVENQCSPVLVGIRVICKIFDGFVFFLFIHCE